MSKLKRWAIGIVAAVCIAAGAAVVMQPHVNAQNSPGGLFDTSGTAMPTTCALDNIGWLVCPILRSAAKAGDYAFTFISHNFLGIEMALFNSDSGTAQAWSSMRNIANILFVGAFLVVIYSLITGRGVGNYNIKRMLPRFIVGAIMVNISYYICQFMIDISNVAGSSINTLFAGITNSIGPSGMPLANEVGSYDATVLIDITASVLGKIGVAWVLFAPLLAIVLSIAIICAVIIVVLIVRKTLVVALILLSPLAFVAYLLPNTEHYFSKWLRLFLQTLLLFPVVAVLLGAGQVVSATIIKAGADGGYEVRDDEYTPRGETGQTSATLRLVAAGAAVLPLAGTWYAFKAALAGADAAALRVRQGSRRSNNHREESAKRREQAAMDINKKSMMMKGINRLQQINAVQDGEAGTSLIGRLGGGSHRGRKKQQQKSDEQMQFDQQVQSRLNDLRENGANGLSPQQVYSRALQRYQDAEEAASGDGQFNINSYEGIDLKAAEAYLLENIGQGGVSGDVVGAIAQAQEKGAASHYDKADKSKSSGSDGDDEKGASSHYDKASRTTGGVSTDDALKSATIGGGAVQAGKVSITQLTGDSDDTGDHSRRPTVAEGRGPLGAPGSEKLSDIEMQAKSRAARYLQESQDEQGIVNDTDLLNTNSSSSTIVSERRNIKGEDDEDSGLKLPRRK
ncbi:MAG: type IV secretion system protein [Candidatus Saccharimonadales bacterium]